MAYHIAENTPKCQRKTGMASTKTLSMETIRHELCMTPTTLRLKLRSRKVGLAGMEDIFHPSGYDGPIKDGLEHGQHMDVG